MKSVVYVWAFQKPVDSTLQEMLAVAFVIELIIAMQ